ncbi:MAG TPA: formimidoylglutamate deiminase [Gemmatimonadales bacterium]|nr:formimidoylglutamate deiminase [Gemmatimonadales bacterium]
MNTRLVVQADLTWTGSRFEPDIRIAIDERGRIAAVGRLEAQATDRLTGRAVLPGFVNVHSHAFQRGLRGQGESFPAGVGSFWTWREAMYRLVSEIDEPAFYRLCVQAFREMLDAGITAVGEFHYFHHSRSADDFAFDEVVLRAAADAGIRIVLLQSYYATGGVGRPLEGAQRRFNSVSPDAFWRQMDRLERLVDRPLQSLGVAPHSIRAAGPAEIAEVYDEATHRKLVCHIHVEEQPKELEEARAVYGKRPLELLNETLARADRVTAVHCTQSEAGDLERYVGAGGGICTCPLTEGSLGDGIPRALSVLRGSGRLSLGSDSNARISMLEEMRWLEYGQRLATKTRGLIVARDAHTAPALLDIGTAGGATALGLDAGRIERGNWADLVVIDLGHPTLAGCDASTLPAALVFGTGNEVVSATYVGGRFRPTAVQ